MARVGIAGTHKEPITRALFRRPLLLGLSLLAAIVFFDATPAAAQFIGIRPFGIPLGVHFGGHYRGRHYRHRSYHRHRHHGRRHAYRGHRHRAGGHHGGGVHVPKI